MISDNILKVKERIEQACLKARQDAGNITIVAVSKNRSVEQIREVIAQGITSIGENKVQEAILKHNDKRLVISNKPIKWHMVGHLQANKVKYAVKLFDLIQSVDSLRLAEEINKESAKINKIQDILLEVKTSPEATKFGLMSEGAVEVIKEISRLKNIRIQGLMTIAPIVDNPQLARPYFRMLRDLRDKICQLPFANYHLPILSMGMTDDFEVAIEEGATMVRIGRAIFG